MPLTPPLSVTFSLPWVSLASTEAREIIGVEKSISSTQSVFLDAAYFLNMLCFILSLGFKLGYFKQEKCLCVCE